MRDRITGIIAIALLAGLAAVTYWYSQIGRYSMPPTPVSREGPDFVVHGVTLTEFDAAGHATNRLYAESMRHYAVDDHAEVQRPRYVSLREDQPQLEAHAQSARIEGSGERVVLSGGVVITRAPGGDGSPPLRLTTERLTAIPDLEQYTTDAAVELDRGSSVVRAIGMDYDNVQRVVRLKSRVRGTIEPRATPAETKR
jgi:lipopolysaccharide export system protein LptC